MNHSDKNIEAPDHLGVLFLEKLGLKALIDNQQEKPWNEKELQMNRIHFASLLRTAILRESNLKEVQLKKFRVSTNILFKMEAIADYWEDEWKLSHVKDYLESVKCNTMLDPVQNVRFYRAFSYDNELYQNKMTRNKIEVVRIRKRLVPTFQNIQRRFKKTNVVLKSMVA